METDKSFEGQLKRLAVINDLMASPETSLEASLELYKEGIEIGVYLAKYLAIQKEAVEHLSLEALQIADILEEMED